MTEWMDAESRASRAQQLIGESRLHEAVEELRTAIRLDPCNPAWHYDLAIALEIMEDYTGACEALESAASLDPEDVEILNGLGINLSRVARYAESLECFEKAESLDPFYEPSYCNRIVTYTQLGQHDDAELMFYLARQIVDECSLCFFNLGQSFYNRGLYHRAVDCWLQASRIEPDLHGLHARIADAFWAMGELDEALAYYEVALGRDPRDCSVTLSIGEILVELDREDEATRRFLSILESFPDNTCAMFCLGRLAEGRDDFDNAMKYYSDVLLLDEDFPGIHIRLAKALLACGFRKQALRHLAMDIHKSHDETACLMEICEILVDAGLVERAYRMLLRLVHAIPNDPVLRHNFAVCCFMTGRFDDGIRHCHRAIKLDPSSSLALYNMALAHAHKGQIVRARRYVKRAMELSPSDDKIRLLKKHIGLEPFFRRIRLGLVRYRKKNRYGSTGS